MSRRPIKFIVADKNIEFTFRGFLERDAFHQSLRCGAFEFRSDQDLLVAVGKNDPGLYAQAGQYASGARATHDHLVIALDADWHGSPGAAAIRTGIQAACERETWPREDVCVVVLDPEIEEWIWQDNPNVERAVGHRGPTNLRADLATSGDWPLTSPKPPRPKEVLEQVVRKNREPRSSALYRRIAAQVSVGKCVSPSFHHLLEALRRWYPA